MAGWRRKWVHTLALSAALICAAASACAQSERGTLSGLLTDLHSLPLEGVSVTARNEASGERAQTTTGKGGSYRFNQLAPGVYTLTAESAALGAGELTGIEVTGGPDQRLTLAMEFDLPVKAREPVENAELQAQRKIAQERLERARQPAVETEESSREVLLAMVAPERMNLPARTPAALTRSVAEIARGWGGMAAPPSILHGSFDGMLASERLEALPLPARGLPEDNAAPKKIAPSEESGTVAAESMKLSGAELQALPVRGRRWQEFVSTQGAPNGAAPATSAEIDGGDQSERFQAAAPRQQAEQGKEEGNPLRSEGRGVGVAEAAIETVRTAAGEAESRTGRTQVETRTGASGWHGQGFLFARGNFWGARNPFTQWVKETAPATGGATPVFTGEPYTPPDSETVWGWGLGRAQRDEKLFWFAALDGYRRNDPGVATVKHPDLFFAQPANDAMQVLSARLGLSSANPVGEGLAAYSNLLETLDGLLGEAPRRAAQWVGFGRIDWQARERSRLTLETVGALWNAPGGGLTSLSSANGKQSFGNSGASEEWLLGRWEEYLSENLLAVTQASAGHEILTQRAETPSAYEQSLLGSSALGRLPQITVDARYGFTIGAPARSGPGSYPDERQLQAQEQLAWAHGGLLFKGGAEIQHTRDAISLLRNSAGTYHYASVENFASDALAFANFGLAGQLNSAAQHNCDQTGKVWRDAAGTLHGLGYLPCYSYYAQTLGPSDWWMSGKDWAGYATLQWQAAKSLTLAAGLRWEREQTPPAIANLANAELPQTEKLPNLGNQWGPRFSLAWGEAEGRLPVLRLGYGMYFARTQNATLLAALTQTGSAKGDLNFFLRPADNLNGGGAPPFPAVLSGDPGSVVKPGAVELAGNLRNPEVHQAVAAVEERLPGGFVVTASAMASLGRRLPVSQDVNIDAAVNPGSITYAVIDPGGLGPIKASTVTVPFYANWPAAKCPAGSAHDAAGFCGRLNPAYQQIDQLSSRANSTWEAGMLRIDRAGRKGLMLHAHYTYAHAMDWNPDERLQSMGSSVLDPAHFNLEYGTGDLDVRHAATALAVWEAPWKLRGGAGRLGNGWMLSGIGHYRSGAPYTMSAAGSLATIFTTAGEVAATALGPGINGSGGDNRLYGVGRNSYRYPPTWKADLRLGKRFNLGGMRQLEVLAESFNLFNHQNTTEIESTGYFIQAGGTDGSLPTLNFMNGLKANTTAFGQPLNVNATNFYRQREMQVGLRLRF
jgi:hypothetical protein